MEQRNQREQLQNQVWEAEKKSYFLKPEIDPYRLRMHLMPPVGWLNDPNGLCQFQGIYHMFFQYSPLNASGGMKAWGHYTSRDLLHWNYMGAPFLPDTEYDQDGVYSGSAFQEDGKLYLYYTGNVKQPGDHDYTHSGREANTVLITSDNGSGFSKKQLLMTNADYPEYYTCHIRDPKVWKQDGVYYMIQGGRLNSDRGAVLLFDSQDLLHWDFHNEVSTPDGFGYMWECPDYFQLSPAPWAASDEKINILSLSPQGLDSETYRYQNIYQSGYFQVIGDITADGEVVDFTEWDMGFDFYAPQTFEDEKGRRILVGWAGIPDADYDNEPTVEMGWQHCFTVPRVLTWRGGKVHQNPVEEYKSLRVEEVRLENGDVWTMKPLPGEIRRQAYEIEVADIDSEDFLLKLDQGESGMALHYAEGIFSMEFYGADAEEIGRGRTRRQMFMNRLDKVQILLDTSIIEVFINDGEYVMTSRYYVDGSLTGEIHCEGSHGTRWQLTELEVR